MAPAGSSALKGFSTKCDEKKITEVKERGGRRQGAPFGNPLRSGRLSTARVDHPITGMLGDRRERDLSPFP